MYIYFFRWLLLPGLLVCVCVLLQCGILVYSIDIFNTASHSCVRYGWMRRDVIATGRREILARGSAGFSKESALHLFVCVCMWICTSRSLCLAHERMAYKYHKQHNMFIAAFAAEYFRFERLTLLRPSLLDSFFVFVCQTLARLNKYFYATNNTCKLISSQPSSLSSHGKNGTFEIIMYKRERSAAKRAIVCARSRMRGTVYQITLVQRLP